MIFLIWHAATDRTLRKTKISERERYRALENEENIALKTTRDSEMTTGAQQKKRCGSTGEKTKVRCEIRLWVLFQLPSWRATINHSHLLPPATMLKYWWPYLDHSSADPHSRTREDPMYMQHAFPSCKHGLARLPEQISFLLISSLTSPFWLTLFLCFFLSKRLWRCWCPLKCSVMFCVV